MKAPMPPSKAAPQISVSIGLSLLLTGGGLGFVGHWGCHKPAQAK